MATPQHTKIVQDRLGYTFKIEELLTQALTAAGKGGNKDGSNIRGNSRLAHLGNFLIQFLSVYVGYTLDSTREESSKLNVQFGSTEHCARVAERADLDKCLNYDTRKGAKSALVLRKAIYAIAAAIFLDSQSIDAVVLAMKNLGLFAPDEAVIDPRMLSVDRTTACQSIHDTVMTCFRTGVTSDILRNNDHLNSVQPQISTPAERTSTDLIEDHGWNGVSVNGTDDIQPIPGIVRQGPIETIRAPVEEIYPTGQNQDILEKALDDANALLGMDNINDLSMLDILSNNSTPCGSATVDPGNRAIELQETPNSAKRRRVTPNSASTDGIQTSRDDCLSGIERQLSLCIAKEAQRCIAHGVPTPDSTILENTLRARIKRLNKRQANVLILIKISIGNSYSIAALQQLRDSQWTQDDMPRLHIKNGISIHERFRLISVLDDKIAYYKLLRRYHIFHLYQDCTGPSSRAATEFVHVDPEEFQRTKKPGNPGNNAKAEVTKFMLSAIYPNLNETMDGYATKYKNVTKLQTLGRRFQALANRFGMGVLGLLPFGGMAKPLDMEISETMIAEVPETAFNTFVTVLDEVEGETLKALSGMVSPIIDQLIYGYAPCDRMHPTEGIHLEQILTYPKGSDALLRILNSSFGTQ
ncbi:uncharacterized protein BDW43DRAFT_315489 [Aspergillus alliaceus]|uniref:uncharacterized protein n=1 Tax=Petromyces alliaceus TaxID=209559 RepID=UPI0012A3C552|nr:uncharacterized protein BDW43DRAFT_315489 [Aspergillus alliaceus]KAB8228848.1 hypothetical protein BDW43DRAFT_315489 [Aspergillus alliaceus]